MHNVGNKSESFCTYVLPTTMRLIFNLGECLHYLPKKNVTSMSHGIFFESMSPAQAIQNILQNLIYLQYIQNSHHMFSVC